MRGRTAILLTATVNPGVYAHQSERNSREDRFRDYIEALKFYTSLSNDKIAGVVLCENSNHDFGNILEYLDPRAVQTEFEIIIFEGNKKVNNIHYGYSELGIIDHAIDKSKIIRNSGSFLKISGRLIITNVIRLLSDIPSCSDFAVDFRRAYWREGGPRYRARTQIMYFSLPFYETFLFHKRDQMIGVCTHIEEYIPIVVESLPDANNIVVRFPIECDINGFAGSDNKSYSLPYARLKRAIRGAVRKKLPRLWL